ncbi:MAG: dihydrofolate reductase family protein [Streptosporangiaceae bacterium]
MTLAGSGGPRPPPPAAVSLLTPSLPQAERYSRTVPGTLPLITGPLAHHKPGPPPASQRSCDRGQLPSYTQRGNSRVHRLLTTEEIAALKSESGGEVMAHGGAAFVQALSRGGLIDEYRLVILPVALGSGLPLFKDLAKPLRVDLVEAKSFPDGTVIHVYQPITTTG